jgi:hypothetical protein
MGSSQNGVHSIDIMKKANIDGIKKMAWLLTMFMVMTIVMYMISPIEWPTYKPLRLYSFVFAYILAFYIGGRYTITKLHKIDYTDSRYAQAKNKIITYLRFTIPVTLIFTFIFTAYNLSVTGISGSLLSRIYTSLADMSIGYYEKTQHIQPQILNILIVLGGPIFVGTIFFGLLFYSELHYWWKILFIILVLTEIIRWLILGTGKGAIAVVVYYAITLLIRKYVIVHIDNNAKRNRKRQDRISWKKISIIVFLAILVFGLVMIGRSGRNIYGEYEFIVNPINQIFKILPLEASYIIVVAFSYLCQGYYGLSLTGHVGWEWTYGFGNSGFLRQRLTNIIGSDVIWPHTYQHRLGAYGWNETSNWHTMYVWFGNDISLYGVAIMMFIFGMILTKSLFDGYYQGNIYAMIVAFLMINVIVYSSMNNQIFANADTFMTFIVSIALWIHSKIALNRNKYIAHEVTKQSDPLH